MVRLRCLCNHVCAHVNMPVCVWWSSHVYVMCLHECHLTSFSLLSYLLAFLPWLFLLSFFRSDWDLSTESCFILCSNWYLLYVAWSRGELYVNPENQDLHFHNDWLRLVWSFTDVDSFFWKVIHYSLIMCLPHMQRCRIKNGHYKSVMN